MTWFTVRKSPAAGLVSAAGLVVALGITGCGGAATQTSDAVVVPEPGVNIATSAPGATPSAGASAPAATPTPASTPAPAAAPAAGKAAEGWGTLKGQIVLGGDAPAPVVLYAKGQAPKDADVICSKNGPIMSEKIVVDSATKGVKNVLVYLTKPTKVSDEAKAAASKADVVFDQKACVFEPHVLAVMAGSKITLKSSDPVNHNVNARFKANSQFNSLLASGQAMPYSPASAERTPTQVVCDVHPWMLAYWMVLDHPYFAVTDEHGNFEIKNVPAGAQNVVVWQESAQFVTPSSGEPIAIAVDTPTTKSWTIDPSKVKK